MNNYLRTIGGTAYSLSHPRTADFVLRDAAHALARVSRYGGHTRAVERHTRERSDQTDLPYSVASHSVWCAQVARSLGYDHFVQCQCLVHDLHEAYTGDVPSPIKKELGPVWTAFERKHMINVRDALGMPHDFEDVVAQIDLLALKIEARYLCEWSPEDFERAGCGDSAPPIYSYSARYPFPFPESPTLAANRYIEEARRLRLAR